MTPKTAGYFDVGELILFGKYKNKKGRIVRFGLDDKGHPIIEIEPVPKGRKQNKVMGLFKIWKAPAVAQHKTAERVARTFIAWDATLRRIRAVVAQRGTMDSLTPRVINAYYRQQRIALDVGRTFENDDYRIHRYRDAIKVTELANAGKRGKKVQVMTLYGQGPMEGFAMEFVMHAKRGDNWNRMKQVGEEAVQAGGGQLYLSFDQERGVDVMPGGFQVVTVNGDKVYVEVGYKEFVVRDKVDQNNLPTCIPAISGGLKSIPVFYRWVKENEKKIEKMTFSDVMKAMKDLGVRYHYYCAMD